MQHGGIVSHQFVCVVKRFCLLLAKVQGQSYFWFFMWGLYISECRDGVPDDDGACVTVCCF